ncbi:MAG TPA: hypothetical protein VK194_11395 [Candidatus Deferrimicrobium sp.]|nr:hypothetical protein [Candidatus Deferrimicrobium sp.]
MTDDAAFEHDLRAMLGARDPGAAPAALSVRVRDRFAEAPRSERRLRLTGWAIGLGSLAVVAVVVLAVVRLPGSIVGPIPGPGATPGATIAPFDPSAAGSGIVARPSDGGWTIVLVGALVAGLALSPRIRRRVPRIAVQVVFAVAAIGAILLGTTPFVDFRDGAAAGGLGWVEWLQPPDGASAGPSGRDTAVYEVAPDGVLTFGFDLHNRGPLPITVLGLTPDSRFQAWGVIQAVGLLRDPDQIDLSKPESTRTFSEVEVAPDERVFLVVAGRASRCALAPGSPADSNAASASFERVDVVYEVLGFQRVTTVELPFIGEVRMDFACMSRS